MTVRGPISIMLDSSDSDRAIAVSMIVIVTVTVTETTRKYLAWLRLEKP